VQSRPGPGRLDEVFRALRQSRGYSRGCDIDQGAGSGGRENPIPGNVKAPKNGALTVQNMAEAQRFEPLSKVTPLYPQHEVCIPEL